MAVGVAILSVGVVGAEPAAADGISAVHFTGEIGTVGGATRHRAWVDPVARRNGTKGLSLWSSSAPSYVNWGTNVVPQGHSYAALRVWVRLRHRRAGESVDVVSITSSQGIAHFDVFVNGRNGRLQWDLWREDTDSMPTAMVLERWYLVEALVEFAGTEHTATVRVDGVDQGTIRSAGSHHRVQTVHVGSPAPKTHGQYYDDLFVRVGDAPLSWIPPTG